MVQSGRVTAKEAELLAAGDPDVIDDVMAGIRVRHASAQLDAAVAAGDLDREEADRVIDRLRTGEHSAELRAWVNRLTRLGREGKGGSVGETARGALDVTDGQGSGGQGDDRPSMPLRTLDVWPVVAVEGLTKRYDEVTAVEDLSFALQPGTVTGFLGPNGAGKTTTLCLLLGLAEPTEGRALVFGHCYQALEHPTRQVGAILESNDFHPGRSGRDHLRVLAAAAEIDPSRVDEMLEMVGMVTAADRAVRTYSLGMRQRLGLAGALLGDPKLLVLDEPANGMDPAGVQWLRTMMRQFAADGGSVLVSSHLLAEVAQSVDRVLIISKGRLVADAALDELARGGQSLEDAYLALTEDVAS